MATLLEREQQFAEKSRRGMLLGALRDSANFSGDVFGWKNIVQTVRHESLFGDPKKVFDTHSAILGTPQLLVENPHIVKTEKGYKLTRNWTTINLVYEVLNAGKLFFTEGSSQLIAQKGEFSAHFNFLFDATSSEAVIRSMLRMSGNSLDLSGYQNSVDKLTTNLILPSPDFPALYGDLIASYEENICRKRVKG